MSDDDFIELHQSDQEKDSFGYRPVRERFRKPLQPWKVKLVFWSTVIGGIAAGTLLFLFFITLFLYFFVPIVLIGLIWGFLKNLRR